MGESDDTPGLSVTWKDGVIVTTLPALRRALQRRYPGIRVVGCEFRKYPRGHEHSPDQEGVTVCFGGEWKQLVAYGLAVPGERRTFPYDELGNQRTGRDDGDESSYVIHHMYDGDPRVLRGTFPSKTLETQVNRIWRRVVRLPRRQKGQP